MNVDRIEAWLQDHAGLDAASLGPPVKPFDELEPPKVNVSDLDGPAVVKLLTEAGFL